MQVLSAVPTGCYITSPPLYSLKLENLAHLLIVQNDSKESIFDDISEDTIDGKSRFSGNSTVSSKETSAEPEVLITGEFEPADDFAFTDMLDDMTDIIFGSDLITTDDINVSDAISADTVADTVTQSRSQVSRPPKAGSKKGGKIAIGEAAPKAKKSRAKRDGNSEAATPSKSPPISVSTTDFAFAPFAALMQSRGAPDRTNTDPGATLDSFLHRFQSLSHQHNTISTPTNQGKKSRSRSAAATSAVVGSTVRPVKTVALLSSVGLSTERLHQHESIYGSRKTSGKAQVARPPLSECSRDGEGGPNTLSIALHPAGDTTPTLGHFNPFRSSSSGDMSSGKEMMPGAWLATFRREREVSDCLALRLATGDSNSLLVDGDVVVSGGVRLQYRDADSTRGSVYAMEAFAEELMKKHPPVNPGSTSGRTQLTRNMSSGSDGKRGATSGRARAGCKSGESGANRKKASPLPKAPAALSNAAGAPVHSVPSSSLWSSAMSNQLMSGAIKRTRSWEEQPSGSGDPGQESIGIPIKRERLAQDASPRPSPRMPSGPQLPTPGAATRRLAPSDPAPHYYSVPHAKNDDGGEETRPAKRLQASFSAAVAATAGSSEHFQQAMMSMPPPVAPLPHSQVDLSLFFSPEELDDILALVNDMEGGGSTSSTGPPDRVELSPISTKRKAGQISDMGTTPSQMYIHPPKAGDCASDKPYPPPYSDSSITTDTWYSDPHPPQTAAGTLPPGGDMKGSGQALYFSSGLPPTKGPGGTPSSAMKSLPGIPPVISSGFEATPRFVLHRIPTAAAPSATPESAVRRSQQAAANRKKSRPQSPRKCETLSAPPGKVDSRYLAVGSDLGSLQVQAKESAERRKAQMIADAAEMVLRMKSSSSTSSPLPTEPSPFLSTMNTLTGNHMLSSSAYPGGSSTSNPGAGSGVGMFRLQGLVGLNSVLNPSSLSAIPSGQTTSSSAGSGLNDGMLLDKCSSDMSQK